MIPRRIYLDANILLDYISTQRSNHDHAFQLVIWCLKERIQLFTSCDIVTTIYYVNAKADKAKALEGIRNINRFCKVIPFGNEEVEATCRLMEEDPDYTDLEDAIQYLLAKQEGCDLIVTNDRYFTAKKLPVTDSETFCRTYLPKADT